MIHLPELPDGAIGWDVYRTTPVVLRRTWWQRLLRRPVKTVERHTLIHSSQDGESKS